jgi:hypothetical protein
MHAQPQNGMQKDNKVRKVSQIESFVCVCGAQVSLPSCKKEFHCTSHIIGIQADLVIAHFSYFDTVF